MPKEPWNAYLIGWLHSSAWTHIFEIGESRYVGVWASCEERLAPYSAGGKQAHAFGAEEMSG